MCHWRIGSAERLAAGRCRQEAFDLVITDLRMPEMDGLMLARAIKTDPQIPRPKSSSPTSVGTE